MANSKQLAMADLCLNCCICYQKAVLLTSQWTLFCQRWPGCSVLTRCSHGASFPKDAILPGPWNTSAGGWKRHTVAPFLFLMRQYEGMRVSPSTQLFVIWGSFNRIITPRCFINRDTFVSASFLDLCALISRLVSVGAQNRLNWCFWHFVWCLKHRLCP